MRLFKIAKDVLNYNASFSPNEILRLFPPEEEGQKYQEAMTFYYRVLAHVKGLGLVDKIKILKDAGLLLNNIKTEPLATFSSKLNAKLEEMKRAKLEVRPL